MDVQISTRLCFQIDFTFIQSLMGIRDVDKNGVTEDAFSEVHKLNDILYKLVCFTTGDSIGLI